MVAIEACAFFFKYVELQGSMIEGTRCVLSKFREGASQNTIPNIHAINYQVKFKKKMPQK